MTEIMIYAQPQTITVKKHQGKPVITLKNVDELHQRAEGTAGRNFHENRHRFIEGEDYYTVALTDNEIRSQFGTGKNASSVILLTEMGYLMLVKSFTDDLAWHVQRQLVACYFRADRQQSYAMPAAAPPLAVKAALPRMRTLPELARELAEHDPKTHLTLPVLRRLVKLNIIPVVYSGRRALVDADKLASYLNTSAQLSITNKSPTAHGVRRVEA